MELSKFKEKFIAFKKYEDKMPGVVIGLNLLRELNKQDFSVYDNRVKSILDNNYDGIDHKVDYYNFENNSIKEVSLVNLNLFLHETYNKEIFYEKMALYNELYWVLCSVYEVVYNETKFKYKNGFESVNILSKFVHGLRVNLNDSYQFNLHQVLKVFDQNYFDEKQVTTEDFYIFLVKFVYKLNDYEIIDYSKEFNSFKFREKYIESLLKLVFFSFELMTLGNNKIYDLYDLSNDNVQTSLNDFYYKYNEISIPTKLHINDLIVSLVVSSSVSQICAHKTINNLFIQAINKNEIK